MLFSGKQLNGMFKHFEQRVFANRGTVNEFVFAAVFDHPAADYGEEGQYSGRQATLTIPTTTAQKVSVGTKLNIDNRNYRITDINPDQMTEGYSKIELKYD